MLYKYMYIYYDLICLKKSRTKYLLSITKYELFYEIINFSGIQHNVCVLAYKLLVFNSIKQKIVLF